MTYVIITPASTCRSASVLVFSRRDRRQGDGPRSAATAGARSSSAWSPRSSPGCAWGIAQRLPGRQGEHPAADRDARHARHGARRRAPHHRRRRRARGAVQARHDDRHRAGCSTRCPYLVLIALAVALVFGVVLAQTRFGRYTYAIGSNEEARAARRHQRRPPPDQGLRAGRHAGRAGRLPVLARFGTTDARRPHHRQPARDRGRRHRRHQPVRRRRHDRSAPSSACSSRPCCRTAS